MRRRPKYQVFISSTYGDLRDEREAVVWNVLKARHIPVGMENFTATNDRGWKTIQNVLDDTDYYVLIVAGMYGTVDPSTGISWTQREYEYAMSKGIPVLAFVRLDSHITADKQERDESRRAQRDLFAAKIRDKHLTPGWATADDLVTLSIAALRNHVDDDEGTPGERLGWYRGDQVTSPEVANALARLTEENAKLRDQLALVERKVPAIDFDSVFLSRTEDLTFEDGYAFLHCAIVNVGTATARDLTIDVTIRDVTDTFLGQPNGPGITPRWMLDPAEHVYVDGYDCVETEGQARQRLKFIAPGVRERLVAMGFEQPLEVSETISVEVTVVVTDNEGRAWRMTRTLRPDDQTPPLSSEDVAV